MFGFFSSVEKKMRDNATNWLELAEKVYHYRRDVLPASQVGELQGKMQHLRQLVKDRGDAAKLKIGIESLEDVLRRTGGSIYPKSGWVENVEFFLVAAIVILGIRTYFVQPFKIPTNSMYPSYYGMTHELFEKPENKPNAAQKVFRFLAFGAKHYEVIAPAAGEVSRPFRLDGSGRPIEPAYTLKSGRKWLIIPTAVREYAFRVNGETATVSVPEDFTFNAVFQDVLAAKKISPVQLRHDAGMPDDLLVNGNGRSERVRWVTTGLNVKKGEPIASFDILTGDQLFVDRLSYHFVQPAVGQGFVFRTGNLPQLHSYLAPGSPTDQYYIKRLVGRPGDALEIREPVLYRNGQPITGSAAFDKNARRAERYPGYSNLVLFGPGDVFRVPKDGYMAFGDNSANSLDSRYWGPVPAKDVIGKPLFIYYPFTRRWGPSR